MPTKFHGAESSYEKVTADSPVLIYTGGGWLTAISIITDGTNDATVMAYDNTAGSGNKIYEGTAVGANNYGGRNWVFPVRFQTGLTITIAGIGASCIAEYIKL